MLKAIKRLLKDEGGQGLVEYALIIGLVVLLIVAAFQWDEIKTAITNIFDDLLGELS